MTDQADIPTLTPEEEDEHAANELEWYIETFERKGMTADAAYFRAMLADLTGQPREGTVTP